MRQSPNFEVLKEPKGFIKIIQVFIAIFAFATCTGYHGNVSFDQKCQKAVKTTSIKFSYPFEEVSVFIPGCAPANITNEYVSFGGNHRSSTEYFVVIGVFCFLYSLGMLVYYVMFEEDNPPTGKFSPPVVDFVISAAFVVFWFTGAIAMAAATTSIKGSTDVTKLIKRLDACSGVGMSCSVNKKGNYATLDISALLGFLNVFVWCGNMWFLYKETPWHRPKNNAATVSGPGRQQPPQVTPPAAAI